MGEPGFHSKRTGVDESAPRLFDVEPMKTGWSKEEGDARLAKIRADLHQRHHDYAMGTFHDRRE